MKNNFDERQLQIRGDIVKHACILFIIFLTLDVIYSSLLDGAHVFGTITGGVIIIMTIALASIEMIKKEVYVDMLNQQNKIAILMGAAGSVALICNVISIIREKKPMILQHEIQASYGMLFIDVCIILICVVFYIHESKTKECE